MASLPDRERAEAKNNNARQNYCGDRQSPDLVCSQLELNGSNSRQGFHGHGQLPDRESPEEKKNNVRQKYCGYGQLPDLVCSQLEQSSSNLFRQRFHGYGQLPDCECFAEKN